MKVLENMVLCKICVCNRKEIKRRSDRRGT